MRKLSVFLNRFGGLFAALALFVGVSISNSACAIIWHQPKEPESMKKYKLL